MSKTKNYGKYYTYDTYLVQSQKRSQGIILTFCKNVEVLFSLGDRNKNIYED